MLVEEFKANIHAKTVDGMPILSHFYSQPPLGKYMILKGVNILELDPATGLSALQYGVDNKISWILDSFIGGKGEAAVLAHGPDSEVQGYVISLVRAGYAKAAELVLNRRAISITPDEATAILNECRGNFEGMKEPIETFELLESLGAVV